MDVVDRYLLNVRAFLPSARAEDLVSELRENVRAQIEDREERLGRPLTEDERIAVLRAHGHPLLVAGAYRADGSRLVLGREVIGTALFPFFRVAILGAAAITVVATSFAALAGRLDGSPPFPLFRTAIYNLAILSVLVTATFAVMQAWFRRTAQTWDPRKLPSKQRRPVTPAARRAQAAIQIVATLAFLWLWTAIAPSPYLRGTGLAELATGPAWRLVYLGVLASSVISLATPLLALVRPEWHRFRWLVSLFSSGAFIAFTVVSMWNGAWVVPHESAAWPDVAALAHGINRGFQFGLGVAVVVVALTTVFEVVRGAWREYRREAAT